MADAGKKSKTNVTARGGAKDPRPKSELVLTSYRKPNGATGLRRTWHPINRD